ncbi:hypothetical protein HN937_18815 [Candidatus Poribacteria bacterium]|nr:hypothetical protein [Candidatus Poribacteria bacterium]
MAISADGSRLLCHYGSVTRLDAGLTRLWDVDGGVPVVDVPTVGLWPRVALTGEGCLLVAMAQSGLVVVYNTNTGEVARRFHTAPKPAPMLHVNGRLPWIVVATENSVLQVWAADRGILEHELAAGVTPFWAPSLSLDGSRVAFAYMVRPQEGRRGRTGLHVWDLATDGVEGVETPYLGPSLSPDGQHMLSGAPLADPPGPPLLWDLDRLDAASAYRPSNDSRKDLPKVAQWLRDGRFLGRDADGRVAIWEPSRPRRLRTLPERSRSPFIEIGERDTRLLTYDWVARIGRVWDIETGRELETLPVDPPLPIIPSAAYSDDGSTIAFARPDREIEVWRALRP